MNYEAFLAGKSHRSDAVGFDLPAERTHPMLFPFQRDIVRWALRRGRAAIFADCGMGKTLMQVEWARHVPGPCLIFAPICVGEQTIAEAAKIGVEIGPHGNGAPVEIVNYERAHKVDPSRYQSVVLDESSILKSVDGKTRGLLLEMFHATPYRLCCTATPAPNDPTEIGNHAHFLGVMTRAEMLASFFVNRGEGNRSWDLKGHAEEAFYRWLASWACFIRRPSDLGYCNDGFDLPPLDVRGEIVKTTTTAPGMLFQDRLRGVTDRSAVRKATVDVRVQRAVDLARDSHGQAIVWCGLNTEQDSVAEALGDECVSVQGADDEDTKRARVARFLSGEARILVSKPSIVGFGMNFQNAPTQVFVGLSDSYETYYQTIRRSWRYGQTRPVTAHIVLTDLEEEILANVKRKETEAAIMQDAMVGRIADMERAEIQGRAEVAPYSEDRREGAGWTLWRGDCIEVMRRLPAASVDLAVFSPPFSSLYTYSASDRDLGNCRGSSEFFDHFAYVVAGLLRLMKPGRLVACHCQQVTTQKARDGEIGLVDFRGDLIRCFQAGGFIYHGEVCIDKNPQAQAIRTKSKSLLFVQMEKDASWLRPALADYILVFRAPGENAVPIKPDCTRDEWIEWAHPIWYHIRESDTLHVAEARDEKDEKHICALQLPTIRRCIRLWSNRGETVLSPFAGIGSEGYEAVLSGRRYVGIELKEGYAAVAAKNLARAEAKVAEGLLFATQGMKEAE